jgi:4-carboxymuconolactone decarboxylase
MKHLARRAALVIALVTATVLVATGCSNPSEPEVTERTGNLESVSPALAEYDAEHVQALWEDESLSGRDRGLVTIAVLVAGGSTQDLGHYIDRALDDGLTPAEISEAVTHLAFYAGWPQAMEAVPVLAEVYKERGIDQSQLPEADPELLAQDEAAEAARAQDVQEQHGTVSQGVVDSTDEVVFDDLWLRPGLEPRDRSLVTVVALITTAQSAQVTFHLNRAMDNGLTDTEVDAVLDHIIFFTGWPRVYTALPIVRDVLDSRS